MMTCRMPLARPDGRGRSADLCVQANRQPGDRLAHARCRRASGSGGSRRVRRRIAWVGAGSARRASPFRGGGPRLRLRVSASTPPPGAPTALVIVVVDDDQPPYLHHVHLLAAVVLLVETKLVGLAGFPLRCTAARGNFVSRRIIVLLPPYPFSITGLLTF